VLDTPAGDRSCQSRRVTGQDGEAGLGIVRGQRALWQAFCAALLAAFCLVMLQPAVAQTFPALSGRVVDAANLLQPEQRAALEAKLKAHEDRTSDQVVIATVPSLGDLTVEDYANRLLRQWKLGQAGKNNGVLFLVAPRERKVRIEVGYGLEGALTDALSKIIITTAVAPRFQQNDFAGGLNAGVDAILNILTGDAEEWQRRAEIREDPHTPIDPLVSMLIFFLLLYVISRFMRGAGGSRYHRGRRGGWIVVPGGGWGGGWSRGGGGWSGGGWSGGGGGGFSGGGGSSGGGGASGSW
jgi:uncharacterized protein